MAKTATTDKYEGVKKTLKAELGDKYPKSTNSLSDEFICKQFLPKLEKEDMVKIANKRKELRNSEDKKANWYPEFRSWVGKNYFPEFGAKKSSKAKTDDIGNFLEELLAKMGD